MKRFLEHKGSVVLLAVAGLIALALLSAALRDLTFRPPEPLSFNFNGFSGAVNPGTGMQIPAWRFFLFGGLLVGTDRLTLAVLGVADYQRWQNSVFPANYFGFGGQLGPDA